MLPACRTSLSRTLACTQSRELYVRKRTNPRAGIVVRQIMISHSVCLPGALIASRRPPSRKRRPCPPAGYCRPLPLVLPIHRHPDPSRLELPFPRCRCRCRRCRPTSHQTLRRLHRPPLHSHCLLLTLRQYMHSSCGHESASCIHCMAFDRHDAYRSGTERVLILRLKQARSFDPCCMAHHWNLRHSVQGHS